MTTMKHLIFLVNLIIRVSTISVSIQDRKSVTFKSGDDVSVDCKVEGETSDIYWEILTHKGTILYHIVKKKSKQEKGYLDKDKIKWNWSANKKDKTLFQLMIKSAEKNDVGEYKCVAENTANNERQISEPVTLSIQYLGANPFESIPKNEFVVAGNTISFGCHLSNKGGDIEWLFTPVGGSRKKLISGDHIFIGTPPKSYLFINYVKKSDEGFYECSANINGQVYNRGADLKVYDRDGFVKKRFEVYLDRRNDKVLTKKLLCEADENTKVAWIDTDDNVLMHDGFKVDVSNPILFFDVFERRQLILKNVSYMDSKSYFCVNLGCEKEPCKAYKWKEYVVHFKGCPPTANGEKWVAKGHLGKCYGTLVSRQWNFGEAEMWCRQKGGHLVMPKTQVETNAIIDSFGSGGWIGLTDFEHEGLYRWLDSSGLRKSQEYWNPGEPNDADDEDCVTFRGKWNDLDCLAKRPFVCETPFSDWARNQHLQEQRCPYGWVYFDCGGFCYKLASHTRNWRMADSYCKDYRGKLAMPKTAREHFHVLKVAMQLEQEVWLGIKRSDYGTGHEWVDGEVENWIYWGKSKSRFGYSCLTMNRYGRINARVCNYGRYFVCQMPQKEAKDLRDPEDACGQTAVPLEFMKTISENTPSYQQGINFARVSRGQLIEIEDIPWMVQLSLKTGKKCGGVLVTPRHVLTAAHCLVNHGNDDILTTSDIQVVIGSDDTQLSLSGGRKENVHMIRVPYEFDLNYRRSSNIEKTYNLDLGVIELKRYIQTDCWKIRRVCINDPPNFKSAQGYDGYKCVYSGWGGGSLGLTYCDNVNIKAEIDYEILIKKFATECTLHPGDDGGPLMCLKDGKWMLGGIMTSMTTQYLHALYYPGFKKYLFDAMQLNRTLEDHIYVELVCDNRWMTISCNYGRPPGIEIMQATYGRMHDHVCPNKVQWKVAPATVKKDVTSKVKAKCQDKNGCTFKVDPGFLGNPVTGKKHLEVQYKCRQHELHQKSCLGKTMFSCGVESFRVIKMAKARWGKSDRTGCPSGKVNTNCPGLNVLSLISEMCDGKVSCTVVTNDKRLGNHCSGYKKYLDVTYTCEKEEDYEIPEHVAFAEEDEGVTIAPNLILLLVLCTAAARLGN